jgi:hypothetical protein
MVNGILSTGRRLWASNSNMITNVYLSHFIAGTLYTPLTPSHVSCLSISFVVNNKREQEKLTLDYNISYLQDNSIHKSEQCQTSNKNAHVPIKCHHTPYGRRKIIKSVVCKLSSGKRNSRILHETWQQTLR